VPGDTLTCQGSTNRRVFDPGSVGGGSQPHDWNTVDSIDAQAGSGQGFPPIPGWTVDGGGSWRLDPNTAIPNQPGNPNKWARQPNGCYVP
jgi:hypothetical protein